MLRAHQRITIVRRTCIEKGKRGKEDEKKRKGRNEFLSFLLCSRRHGPSLRTPPMMIIMRILMIMMIIMIMMMMMITSISIPTASVTGRDTEGSEIAAYVSSA